ncbi:MAG: serine hydrolase domain-containing protein [Shimia sp.]
MSSDGADVWPWWSITKTVLAVAVLRLHDLGRLHLDAPTRFHPATLRQLLTHTGGVPSYTRRPDYAAQVARRGPAWSFDEMTLRMASEEDDFPPGRGWSYSNTGYAFVRRAIEGAEGDGIGPALDRLVFAPLGLSRTKIVTSAKDAHCPLLRAEGYDPGWVYHGLACGPAEEAVRFLDGALSDGFLSDTARALPTASVDLGGAVPGRPWVRAAYGLGTMCAEMVGHGRVVGHSGGGPFSVSALYRTERGAGGPRTACAFVAGTDEGQAEWMVHRLLR